MQKERVVIACISPYLGLNGAALYIPRTYNSFLIPACQKDQKYTKVVIEDQVDYRRVESGDLSSPPDYVPVTISALSVANDIIEHGNLKNEGGFICAGSEPTEDELAEAHENRRKWLVASVQRGDSIFAKMGPRGIEHIPDYAKRAVAELGVTRDWVFQPEKERIEPARCEGCATPITMVNGAMPAVCVACGVILNAPLHARLFPAAIAKELEPVEVKQGKHKA